MDWAVGQLILINLLVYGLEDVFFVLWLLHLESVGLCYKDLVTGVRHRCVSKCESHLIPMSRTWGCDKISIFLRDFF